MEGQEMTLEEQKQAVIDNYVNLMRIKADETAENKELERQIKITRLKQEKNIKQSIKQEKKIRIFEEKKMIDRSSEKNIGGISKKEHESCCNLCSFLI